MCLLLKLLGCHQAVSGPLFGAFLHFGSLRAAPRAILGEGCLAKMSRDSLSPGRFVFWLAGSLHLRTAILENYRISILNMNQPSLARTR